MSDEGYPRLCGGTFFTLVLEARKQRMSANDRYQGNTDPLSDTATFIGLIRVMDPGYTDLPESAKGTFKGNTSDYRLCKTSSGVYMPFKRNCDEVKTFDARVKGDYADALMAMLKFTNFFIDANPHINKDVKLTRQLLELIKLDDSIKWDEDYFYSMQSGEKITKRKLLNLNEVCFESLLLGIWHFILTNRPNNKVGKDTIDQWCPATGGQREYVGSIGEDYKKEIEVVHCTEEGWQQKPDDKVERVEAETVEQGETEFFDSKDKESKVPDFSQFIVRPQTNVHYGSGDIYQGNGSVTVIKNYYGGKNE